MDRIYVIRGVCNDVDTMTGNTYISMGFAVTEDEATAAKNEYTEALSKARILVKHVRDHNIEDPGLIRTLVDHHCDALARSLLYTDEPDRLIMHQDIMGFDVVEMLNVTKLHRDARSSGVI